MIGNAEEAALIHGWYHGEPARVVTPKGWRRLGEGSFRAAYLAPSGVVYKVEKEPDRDRYQTNLGEWKTWKRLWLTCKMPRHSRLPQMNYFPIKEGVGVIAVEYLVNEWAYYGTFTDEWGNKRYWSDVCREIASVCRVGDLAGDNLFLSDDEKLLIPIDLADSWTMDEEEEAYFNLA